MASDQARNGPPGAPLGLYDAVESRVAIRRHPLHPLLVPFPIAAVIALLGSDFAYWLTQDPFWARASLWLAGFGAITGAVAAAAGAVDFVSIRKVSKLPAGTLHAFGNAILLLLLFSSWLLRLPDPAAFAVPGGLVLSHLLLILVGVTGWAGGELSYRYRVGIIPADAERS